MAKGKRRGLVATLTSPGALMVMGASALIVVPWVTGTIREMALKKVEEDPVKGEETLVYKFAKAVKIVS